MVNETSARRYWPGESPVGRRIRIPGIPGEQWITVIGVVADVRMADLASPVRPTTYYPMSQAFEGFGSNWGMDLVVRTEAGAADHGESLRGVIQSANSDLPVFALRMMRQAVSSSIAGERRGPRLSGRGSGRRPAGGCPRARPRAPGGSRSRAGATATFIAITVLLAASALVAAALPARRAARIDPLETLRED